MNLKYIVRVLPLIILNNIPILNFKKGVTPLLYFLFFFTFLFSITNYSVNASEIDIQNTVTEIISFMDEHNNKFDNPLTNFDDMHSKVVGSVISNSYTPGLVLWTNTPSAGGTGFTYKIVIYTSNVISIKDSSSLGLASSTPYFTLTATVNNKGEFLLSSNNYVSKEEFFEKCNVQKMSSVSSARLNSADIIYAYIDNDSSTGAYDPNGILQPPIFTPTDLSKPMINIINPKANSSMTGNGFRVNGQIVYHLKNNTDNFPSNNDIEVATNFIKLNFNASTELTNLNIRYLKTVKIDNGLYALLYDYYFDVFRDFNGIYTVSTKQLLNGSEANTLEAKVKILFTKDENGDFTNPDNVGTGGDNDKPSRPDGLNPIDWIIYIFDTIVYYIQYLLGLIIKVFQAFYSAIVSITNYANSIGQALQGLYSWLPVPIPELINTSFIFIVVMSVIRVIRG